MRGGSEYGKSMERGIGKRERERDRAAEADSVFDFHLVLFLSLLSHRFNLQRDEHVSFATYQKATTTKENK